MDIKVIPGDKRASIVLAGSVDERGAEELKRRLLDLEIDSLEEVELDFGGVTFIGSAGIGKLLLLYKSLAAHGGKLSITNLSKDIFTMFKVIKLDQIFQLN
ncbi:MAG: anti-sigma factor antagonist [Desulfarculus sp.]|jgi:anti-anti-sigma factor|nr:MAG: anti-sigma factor antagonist [Desulfarculus sp.]